MSNCTDLQKADIPVHPPVEAEQKRFEIYRVLLWKAVKTIPPSKTCA